MGLNFISDFRSVLLRIDLRKYGRMCLFAGVTLALSVGTARSYVFDAKDSVSRETQFSFDEIVNMTEALDAVQKNGKHSKVSGLSSSAAGNFCTTLLNTQGTFSQKTPVVRSQRPVGKVAALGLLLGARFALAPQEQHNRAVIDEPDVLLECQVVKVDDKDAPVRSARAVAAYRQCKKDQALARIASAR